MKHSNDPISEERFRDLQYLYLEDLLAPKEKSEFEEHLKLCPNCSNGLEEMRQWITKLKEGKEAMCPESWEIYEHVQSGEQTPEDLRRHMETCESCAQEARSLKGALLQEKMPWHIWEAMEPRFGQSVTRKGFEFLNRWFADLAESFFDMFQAPVPAVATVTAAVLLVVVLLYPFGGTAPMPMLSEIRWGLGSDINLMSGRPSSKEREATVATIIFLKGFKQPFKEERIDSLYGSLAPTLEMEKRFTFVSPGSVKEMVTKGRIQTDTIDNILRGLSDTLNVSQVVALTLTPVGDAYSIEGELVNTRTGKILARHIVNNTPGSELLSQMKTTAQRLLLAK